jgi:hypothetical protein
MGRGGIDIYFDGGFVAIHGSETYGKHITGDD